MVVQSVMHATFNYGVPPGRPQGGLGEMSRPPASAHLLRVDMDMHMFERSVKLRTDMNVDMISTMHTGAERAERSGASLSEAPPP